MAEVRVEPVAPEQLEALLPLIAAYQRFYEVDEIDEERNRAFFARFLAPSEHGMLLGAWRGEELLGHACLSWYLDSLRAEETVQLSDLYVVEAGRGQGVGRALVERSVAIARERSATCLHWITSPDNDVARRLYDSTGAASWPSIEYELRL